MKDLDFFCTAVKSATTHTGADIWDSCLAVRCSDFTLSTSAAFGFMSITQTFSLLQEGHVSGGNYQTGLRKKAPLRAWYGMYNSSFTATVFRELWQRALWQSPAQ